MKIYLPCRTSRLRIDTASYLDHFGIVGRSPDAIGSLNLFVRLSLSYPERKGGYEWGSLRILQGYEACWDEISIRRGGNNQFRWSGQGESKMRWFHSV